MPHTIVSHFKNKCLSFSFYLSSVKMQRKYNILIILIFDTIHESRIISLPQKDYKVPKFANNRAMPQC